jgi:hypothetical protein
MLDLAGIRRRAKDRASYLDAFPRGSSPSGADADAMLAAIDRVLRETMTIKELTTTINTAKANTRNTWKRRVVLLSLPLAT